MDFEELDIDLGELETIEKFNFSSYTYPVAHVGDHFIYFNRFASSLVPTYIRWSVSTEYVIAAPTDKDDPNAFKTRKPFDCNNCIQATFPSRLRREKKLQTGYYKLFKYKDGFALKRYEPIDDKN